MAASDQSSWDQKVQVTALGFNEAYTKAWLSFECLSLAALLVFFVWSCFIRQPRGDSTRPLPLKALTGSILSYACTQRTNHHLIPLFLGIFKATVQQSYVVLSMLNQIFYLLAAMLGFYIFWHVVQKLLERVAETNPNKAFAPLAIVHWVLLGIMSAIAAAECAMYIAFVVRSIDDFSGSLLLAYEYNALSAALSIICWVASMEILGWVVFVSTKAGGEKKTGLPAITIGIFFFFLINFVMAILQILYVLEQNIAPDYLDAARAAIEFICTIGIYTGTMLGFQQWSRATVISAPRQKSMEDYEQQIMEDSDSSNSSTASTRSSYHNRAHSPPPQQQFRYSVPEGAPSAQQVHMWMPSR